MGNSETVTPGSAALPEHEVFARLFRTLGDATRLRLLEALLQFGEASQKELIDTVGVTQSRASEHLLTLRLSGLVRSERTGRSVRYRLTGDYAERFLRQARTFLYDHDEAVGGCAVRQEEPSPGDATRRGV